MLVYMAPHPKQNKLMLCNLSKNISQQKLHFNFNILCFVEAGSSISQDSDPKEVKIYFLGESDDKTSLFELSIKPWVDASSDEISLTKIEMLIDFSRYQKDKIKKCQVIFGLKRVEKVVLLVQLSDNIILFESDRRNDETAI